MRSILSWFVSGPGAGYLTYELLEVPWIKRRVGAAQAFLMGRLGRGKRESKRIVAFLVAAALSLAGYYIMILVGWQPRPANWEELANTVVQVSGVSGVVSQLVHGGRELDDKEEYNA